MNNVEEGERRGKGVDLPKPVEVGDIVEITIESVGAKGDGIGKTDGFVIFVPGVKKGETVKVKVTELRKTFGIGEKVEG